MLNEVAFGVDNFGKQKILPTKDSIAQLIINILFLRPGQLPSLPHIGINFKQYLYAHIDDIDTGALKEELSYQCSELTPFIDMSGIQIVPLEYQGRTTLYIVIPINVDDSEDNLLIGVAKDTNGRVIFNYKFDDNI